MDLELAKAAIKKCDIFRDVDEDALGVLLVEARERTFHKGEIVYRRGEMASDSFYLIVSGEMHVLHESGELIKALGPTEIIGEIGVISPKRLRTRDVIAGTATEVLEWDVHTIQARSPELLERLKDLAWQRISDWPD
ncbi:cyclic nucleotide-binding domain-containing protein [bacterium]|nr:cyclic nucleotide-binding domain-containing protein [bacterium]